MKISIEKGVDIFRHQFGRWLGFFRQWFGDDETCVQALAHDFSVPKRFNMTKQDWARVHPDFVFLRLFYRLLNYRGLARREEEGTNERPERANRRIRQQGIL